MIRAVTALLRSHLQRLVRESMARRALGFPVVLTTATLLATLAVVSIGRGVPAVATTAPLEPAAVPALDEAGLRVVEVVDAQVAVRDGAAIVGLDGTTLWTAGGRDALVAEQALRTARQASWAPMPPPLPGRAQAASQGQTISTLLMAIYALYGVVFGAGMIARDRDDGTLEVELTLALPKAVHGFTRWTAATLVVGLWVSLAVLLTASLLGLPDAGATLRHGVAATGAAVALGLASVGRAGIQSGFAASLAAGLSLTTGLLGLGYALPSVGAWLPLSSLAAGGSGYVPLLGMFVLAALSIGVFTWRSASA